MPAAECLHRVRTPLPSLPWQENAKVIKLKTLTENSNLRRLAEDIVDKCKLIHESKLGRVEELLHQLRSGKPRGGAGGKSASDRGGRSRRTTREMESEAGGGAEGGRQEIASLSRLEQYVEMMYDGTESATAATHQVTKHFCLTPLTLPPPQFAHRYQVPYTLPYRLCRRMSMGE
jgi:hypothetical protein